MILKNQIPSTDGFHMPGEFEPHQGCVMIWPDRPGSWPFGAKAAKRAFTEVAAGIAKSEKVYMLAEWHLCAEAEEYLRPFVKIDRICLEVMESVLKMEPDRTERPCELQIPAVPEKPQVSQVPAVPEKPPVPLGAAGKAESDVPTVEIIPFSTDDAWARDVCPTFVVNDAGWLRGISWRFNAWGGDYDGLYAHWEQDDACAGRLCEHFGIPYYDTGDFVLEGGSIHSDGEGTVLVTEACLLSPGRNPQMTKEEIEDKLKSYLGAKKVIWLPHGIYGDETNEHVDNVCAFVRPGEVVLAWPEDGEESAADRSGKNENMEKATEPGKMTKSGKMAASDKTMRSGKTAASDKAEESEKTAVSLAAGEIEDPDSAKKKQLEYSESCLKVLESEKDARGRQIRVHKLPLPKRPVCIQKEDLPGFLSEEGEAERYEGEQLAASYVNFYIANRSVLVPQFGDENDPVAVEILSKLFPEREIIPVYARDILMGGGNIHCITQQIPVGL